MITGQRQRAVGVFSNLSDAEYALTELRGAGFNMDKVSVIVKDTTPVTDVAGVNTQTGFATKADETAAAGAITGTILGGITGLVVGLGTLAIPGVGPVLLAGEIATTLATTAAGAGIGAAAGGLLGALMGLGIPEERARVYNEHVTRGSYLIVVEGSQEDIHRAEKILTNQGIEELGIYEIPAATTVENDYINPANTTVEPTDRVNTTNNPNVIIVDRRDETII